MKETRNFKVRIHNGPNGDAVYLINAETHYDVYRRFCGIMLNNGFYHTRAIWRPLKQKPPTIEQVRRYGSKLRTKRTIRTYYFYPSNTSYLLSSAARRNHEAAIEIIKLK
jgi:hypothetical protein